jgi:hypothetical protein
MSAKRAAVASSTVLVTEAVREGEAVEEAVKVGVGVLEWLLVEEVVLQEDWEEEAVEEVVRVARGVVEELVVPVMEAVLGGEEVKLWVGRAVTLIRAVLLWDRVTEVVLLDM